MCETLGTDWEATAKEQISLKLEAWKAIQRVRELHFAERYANTEVCRVCNTNQGIAIEYPCPTIKVLDNITTNKGEINE